MTLLDTPPRLREPEPADGPSERERRDRAALGEFLRGKRENADPDRFPLTGSLTRASALRGVSQPQVAEALGMTEGWYRQIELGKARLELRFVEKVVRAFELNATERAELYLLSQGWEPDVPLTPLVVGPELRAIIDALPYPAYLSGPSWTIEYANAHLPAMFPPLRAGRNVMLEAMTNPVMRDLLADWREAWARPMLGQLRDALGRVPEPYLSDLRILAGEIRRLNPEADEVWRMYPDTVYVRPNGAVRPVTINGRTGQIRLGASHPDGLPHCSMIWIVPLQSAPGQG